MGIMRPIRKTPDFNPRSPCGERLERAVAASTHISISIHALLAESDPALAQYPLHSSAFQSTLSLRRATATEVSRDNTPANFNPRSPCGERRRGVFQ